MEVIENAEARFTIRLVQNLWVVTPAILGRCQNTCFATFYGEAYASLLSQLGCSSLRAQHLIANLCSALGC